MKIAPICSEHTMLTRLTVLVFILLVSLPGYGFEYECEDDQIKPTIEFPAFPDVITGDTMFFDCRQNVLGVVQDEALIYDNCDPDPLIGFGEFCQETGDCSNGFRYLAKCIWTVVDQNNNVAEFVIYAAINDETPPIIELDWGDNIQSGDTLFMECGSAESFDESYVSVEDECDLSLFCEIPKEKVDIIFVERIIGEGDCDEYITEMQCAWIAADKCGNSSTFELTIFVVDNNPPEFMDVPDHFCGSKSLTEEQFISYQKDLLDIQVTDACTSPSIEYTIDELNDGCDYFIQWQATDACGNVSYHQQHVCIVRSDCVGQISGTVRLDNDKDKLGDEPLSAVPLFLIEDLDADGVVDGGERVFLTTSTDENGYYEFMDVPQGCYIIVELQPSGLFDVSDKDVTNPGDQDVDGTNDPTDNLIPVCVGPGEFDDGNDFVEEQIVLEVLLTSFTASYNDENKAVVLVWETEYELASEYFLVERSYDGKEFKVIGQVASKGENSAGAIYEYTDNVLINNPTLYYRLREIDTDGTATYSDISAIDINTPNDGLFIYPNPSSGIFNIYSSAGGELSAFIELFDITGNLIYSLKSIDSNIRLNLAHLENGTYLLRLNSSSRTYVEKLVVSQ